jgi:hypothetical protein
MYMLSDGQGYSAELCFSPALLLPLIIYSAHEKHLITGQGPPPDSCTLTQDRAWPQISMEELAGQGRVVAGTVPATNQALYAYRRSIRERISRVWY